MAASNVIPFEHVAARIGEDRVEMIERPEVVEASLVGDAPDSAQVPDRAVLRGQLDAERGHSPNLQPHLSMSPARPVTSTGQPPCPQR
jgi:hypothetical protein